MHPAGIVDAGARGALLAEMRKRIPARIEENEENANVMSAGNGEKGIDAFLKTGSVLLPKEIVKKHAHGVEADGFGPAEFEVDALWVEGVGLPHFEFVDGRGRDVVAADEPWLCGIPILGALFRPAGWLCEGRRTGEKKKKN